MSEQTADPAELGRQILEAIKERATDGAWEGTRKTILDALGMTSGSAYTRGAEAIKALEEAGELVTSPLPGRQTRFTLKPSEPAQSPKRSHHRRRVAEAAVEAEEPAQSPPEAAEEGLAREVGAAEESGEPMPDRPLGAEGGIAEPPLEREAEEGEVKPEALADEMLQDARPDELTGVTADEAAALFGADVAAAEEYSAPIGGYRLILEPVETEAEALRAAEADAAAIQAVIDELRERAETAEGKLIRQGEELNDQEQELERVNARLLAVLTGLETAGVDLRTLRLALDMKPVPTGVIALSLDQSIRYLISQRINMALDRRS